MKIRMKLTVSGSRDGQAWPPRGEVADLPDDEAAQLCARGIAEPVTGGGVEKRPDDRPVEVRSGMTTKNTAAVVPGGDQAQSRAADSDSPAAADAADAGASGSQEPDPATAPAPARPAAKKTAAPAKKAAAKPAATGSK